jgi:hypothetical protein
MKTIEHEGQTFVLKSDMEAAFQARIQKLSSRAIQAEEQAKTLQEQIDSQTGKLGAIDNLNDQIRQLGEQLQNAESKYSRHMAIAELGFQDEDMREMVEWSYDRAMKGQEEKTPLADWLKTIKEDPTKAPKALRPHLNSSPQATQPPEATQAKTEAPKATKEQIQDNPPLLPPKTNTGAQATPAQTPDILSRGAEDFEFYKANRDTIRKAWKTRR